MSASEIPAGARPVRQPQGYTLWYVGDRGIGLRDAYHWFLRGRWPTSIALIGLAFLVVNLAFAVVYMAVGGVEGLRASSFFDSFVFSVQTLGTIGYGVMHPESHAANCVMIVEAITGIIFTALVTGLVFTKFARATARVAFSENAVITPHDGKPTLIFRCGNRRANVIVEAQLHVICSRTTKTVEGETFYKLYDLKLVRDRQAGMRRGWTVLHVIDETSPLYQLTAADLEKYEVELEISLVGLDDVTMQTVHTIHHYSDKQIKHGHRFEDTIRGLPNGDVLVDMTKFNAIVPDTVPRDSVRA
ncbi:MAG TPA: ion channel [Gemmatimonadaceae bacterium]|nr:ion channel [Gemmatimonadaceae bacterium]